MSAAEPRRPLLRRLAPLLIAVVLGALAGHATATSPSPQPASARAPRPAQGGARTDAGVPVSFPESATGAAAAMAAYQQSFASTAILSPGVLRARLRAIATPDYAARMLEANGPGAEGIAAGPIGVGVAHGLRTLYAAVPIGYRVLSYRHGRAEVETWGFTLLGNAGTVEPSAYFGLSKAELVWLGGRWRIAQIHSGFGPTPHLATPPGPLGGYDVLGVAQGLRSYVLAP
jgi:hypothetical protein